MRVFIGYDQRQPVAFHVAAQSLWNHASIPVEVTPLILRTLPVQRRGLTEFTYSRFLVPWLCGYRGYALFVDADVLFRADVAELGEPEAQVSVVDHAGERLYECPAIMLFNCAKCEVLTPEFVETDKNPLNLKWTAEIGHLPPEWNHLVGYDAPRQDAKIVHFTQGIPCFSETKNAEFSEEWHKVARQCMSTVSWEAIMGSSVHRQFVKPAAA